MVGIFFAPFGGILSGWLGRRKLMIIAAPIVACGWMVIGLAQDKNMLYIGRIMTSGTHEQSSAMSAKSIKSANSPVTPDNLISYFIRFFNVLFSLHYAIHIRNSAS